MLIAVAVLASLGFIVWLIYRTIKQMPVRAYMITRVLAYVTGIFTFAFFLSMDIPLLIQVLISILLGAAVIVLAALLQRRRQPRKP